jgi:folylpolyglutamate synthase/dihydropteroate synthase
MWYKRGFRRKEGMSWSLPNIDLRNKAVAVAAVQAFLRLPYAPRDPLNNVPDWMYPSLQFSRPALRGRREVVRRHHVLWLLDGAHTPHSTGRIAKFLDHFIGRRVDNRHVILLFNQQDPERNVEDLLKPLIDKIHNPIVAAFCSRDDITPVDGADLSVQHRSKDFICQYLPQDTVHVTDSVATAVDRIQKMGEDALASGSARTVYVLVTGSFKLVGAALRVLEGINDELV